MWTTGHYPFAYRVDHEKAWTYYSYASQKGQIDSKIVVAHYAALADHPLVQRSSQSSAMYGWKKSLLKERIYHFRWARVVADESSAVGTITRRALKAYRDRRW